MTDELQNLAENLSEEKLLEIGREVVRNYESDEADRQDWLEMHAKWKRLYFQMDEPKRAVAEWMSRESMPIVAEACNQYAARAFKAFFAARNMVKAIPVGNETRFDRDRADRVSKHMAWQLLVRDRNYRRNKRRLLLSTAVHGSHFTKTYYDPIKQRNIVENVRAEDLVVPYGNGPRDIEEVERKTQILWYSLGKGRHLFEQGFFLEEPKYYEKGDNRETTAATQKAEGIQPAETYHGKENDAQLSKILECHCYMDLERENDYLPYIIWVDNQTERVLRAVRRYDDENNPVEYYTHWPFIENPDGFYSLGMGHLVGQLNAWVNKALRQVSDAATLANHGNHSGFISSAVAPQGGELFLELGRFKKIAGSGEDINRGIAQFRFPGPQSAHLQTIELLMSRADRLATVTEMLTGQSEKVLQPTTALALIEQGLEQFSSIQEGQLDAWSNELMKIYRLNGLYLDVEEYFEVLDQGGNVEEFRATRDDYSQDLQIIPIADPRLTTEQQRLTRAEAEAGITTNYYAMQAQLGPALSQEQKVGLYNATIRHLKSLQTEDIQEILAPPPPPQQPQRQDDAAVENMAALIPNQPSLPPAHPEQDQETHLLKHTELLNDPMYSDKFPTGGREALQRHVQEHIALIYGLNEQAARSEADIEAQAAEAFIEPELQALGGLPA